MLIQCLFFLFVLIPSTAAAQFTMEETVQQALRYNPAVKSAQAGRDMAVAGEERARAGFKPTVTLSGGSALRQSATSTTRAYGQSHDVLPASDISLRLSQPLWTGGATAARVEVQQANLRSADSLLLDSVNSLVYEAVATHATVLCYMALLQVADAQIQAHEEILGTVRQRFQTGAATSGEVTQIESRISRVRAQRAATQAALDAANAEYLRVTGIEPLAGLSPVPQPARQFAAAEEVVRAGHLHNPRLLSAKAAIDVRTGEKKLAHSAFYPTVSAEAGPVYERQFGSKSEPERSSMEAGVRVRWELYSGGADEAAVRERTAGVAQARQDLQRYADQLKQDVTSTWSSILSADLRVKQYGSAMKFSRNTRENFYEQFLAGQRSLLDLLDADSEYFNSHAERVLAENALLLGRYRLLALAGELASTLGVQADAARR